MHPPVLEALYRVLSHFEGVHQSMYCDSLGLVTVGIGLKIDPFADALELGLGNWSRRGGGAVTRADLEQEWNYVKRPNTQPAGWHPQLVLGQAAIRRLLESRARENEGMLRRVFPRFDGYPADAQLGMLCHTWVCASEISLRSRWGAYVDACTRQDWRRAGPQSLWAAIVTAHQPRQAERRYAMLRMFDNAAVVKEVNDLGRSFRLPIEQLYYPFAAIDRLPPEIRAEIQSRQH
jgi:hypothetical protein